MEVGTAPRARGATAGAGAGAPRPARSSGGRGFGLAVVGVVVLGALAYLPNLTTGTLLVDERVYLEAGDALLDGDSTLNREHPPLAKLLFGLVARVVGDPLLGGRLVAVAAGFAIASAVYVLVRGLAGRWWGLGGAALWLVLPHALRSEELAWGGFDRLDRYALLDPVATAFALWALVAAVAWHRDGRVRWGLFGGVLVGLAAGSKVSGGLVGPVLAAVPFAAPIRAWSWRTLAKAAAVAVVALATFALTYAPLGGAALDAFRFMVDFQGGHARAGHDVVVAGQAYAAAPWWAQGWYAWRDEGGAMTVALSVAALVGLVAGPGDWARRMLVAGAVAVPLLAFALSSVLLPHYRFLWLPALVVLATLGLAALADRRGRGGTVLAVALAAALVVTGIRSVAHVTTRRPADYPVAARMLADAVGRDARVLVRGFPGLITFYEEQVEVVDHLAEADAVVLDPAVTDLRPAPGLRARLEGTGDWQYARVDRLDVWVRQPGGAR